VSRNTITRGLAVLIALLVAADWGTKLWVTNRLALGETRSIIDGWLYFVHRQNPGVAFSLFADLPTRWSVPVLAAVALGGVVVFARIMRSSEDRFARIAAALVIAGALGNTGDRVFSGEVTDFVFLAFFPFVFNLADTAITLGGSVLAFRMAVASESATATADSGTG
jgi:signal peptidase II